MAKVVATSHSNYSPLDMLKHCRPCPTHRDLLASSLQHCSTSALRSQ
jgi:hypothetical protein